MNTLQELVSRARLIINGSKKRAAYFKLINGKRSAKEIARKTGSSQANTLKGLQMLRDLELIDFIKDENGKVIKKENSLVYEKVPLLKHLSESYFQDPTRLPKPDKDINKKFKTGTLRGMRVLSAPEILDICKNNGEDQLYEFKRAGVEMKVLSKEICAFANTKDGGYIFYGVEDDGTIGNSDISRQKLDQSLRNSIRNTISPSLTVKITENDVIGHKIIIISIPPWNRKNIYQYEGRVCLRQGTNVFYAKPDELQKLHKGNYVV